MPKQYNRTDRIATLIQRELVRLIQREIKDPRLEGIFISISAIKISKDLSHAKSYVTTFGKKDLKPEEIIKILNGASSYLRSELGKCLSLRSIPQLIFVYDYSIAQAAEMHHLIDKAIAGDKAKHQAEEE